MTTTSTVPASPPPLPGAATAAGASRFQSVDVVKGIAIFLVVLGHVMQGMAHRAQLSGPRYFFAEHFIYSFHMPAFFFVAGLFVDRSIAKYGSRTFITDKLGSVLYPYLLWAALVLPILPFLRRFDHSIPPTLHEYLQQTAIGDGSWFLFTLFFVLLLTLATHRVPLLPRLCFAVILSLFWPNTGHHGIDGIFQEFVFVVAGQLVGMKIARLNPWKPLPAAALSALLFAAIAGSVWAFGAGPVWRWLFIPLGLTGTAALFFLAVALPSRAATALAWIGEASIAVFLLHPYFQGSSRLAVAHLHQPAVWMELLIPTLIATLIPALLYQARRPLHIGFLFRFPKAKARPGMASPGLIQS